MLLGYFERSKAHRLYNSKIEKVEETIHVKFDDKDPDNQKSEKVENFGDIEIISNPSQEELVNPKEPQATTNDVNSSGSLDAITYIYTSSSHQGDMLDNVAPSGSSFKYKSSHPEDLIIGKKMIQDLH